MGKSTVYVVSSDVGAGDSIRELVLSAGLEAWILPSLRAFLEEMEPLHPACLVLDANIPDLQDMDRQARLTAAFAMVPGLLITDRGDVSMAVRAVQAGALDVVQKPYRTHNLLDAINRALAADAALHHSPADRLPT